MKGLAGLLECAVAARLPAHCFRWAGLYLHAVSLTCARYAGKTLAFILPALAHIKSQPEPTGTLSSHLVPPDANGLMLMWEATLSLSQAGMHLPVQFRRRSGFGEHAHTNLLQRPLPLHLCQQGCMGAAS